MKKDTLNFINGPDSFTALPRRWFPLWKLDGYIFREFMIKYGVLLLVFVILFMLSDVYQDISGFLDAKAPYQDILTYLWYRLPGNIRFILPISMLLGCMWTMATFGKNMEVTAMRASGVSLFRCGGSIFAVGLIVTVVNVYFNEILVPEYTNKAQEIYDRVADRRRYVKHLLAYRSDDQKRRWLFNSYTSGEEQANVTVKMFWNDSMISRLIGTPGTPGFKDRIQTIFGPKAKKLLELEPEWMRGAIREALRGRKVDFFAARTSYDYKREQWNFFDGYFVSYDRNDETQFEASKGTSAMHPEIKFDKFYFTPGEIPESPEDIINAVKEKEDLSTPVIWEILRSSPNMADRVRAIYETVFYYRIAFPWACFLAVFLGIPLATKNERTGSLLAVITAVAVIIIYMVVAQIFLVLGKGGLVNPVIAGLAPTLGFIICWAWRILTDRN